MKKIYYFFLSLILCIGFSYAEDSLPNTILEEENASEISPDESDTFISPKSNLDENRVQKDDVSNDGLNKKVISSAESINTKTFSQDTTTLKNLNLKIVEKRSKSPTIAVLSQLLIPGLGHAYLGDYKTAASLFGSSALGYGGLFNKHTEYAGSSVVQTSMFYGIYAAYRDARLYNSNLRYSYKMPTDSFKDLCFAPFNPKIMKKPEVWGGLLGDFALVVAVAYLYDKLDMHVHRKISIKDIQPLEAFGVGISEESLFRGYLQSTLSENLNPASGIILSSLAFGAAHLTNTIGMDHQERRGYYAISIPYITLGGAYYGWVAYKNRSIQETVALHGWYDFVLFTLDRIFDRSLKHEVFGQRSFSFSLTF